MGQQIEFDRRAYEFTSETEFGSETSSYILTNVVGSSNSFDSQGNIARRWNVAAIGTETEVMSEMASIARSIERGSIRYQNGQTKIENYLRNWRKAIDDSRSLGDFQQDFWKQEATVYEVPQNEVQSLEDRIRKAYETVTNDWRRSQPEDTDKLRYKADVRGNNIELIELLYKNLPNAPVRVKISGRT